SFASTADLDSDSRSAIAADVDRDGDLDLLVGSVGGGPIRLLQNQIRQGHRVVLSLTGRDSNRSGIGCRVTIRCEDQSLIRDLFPANGFMGTGPTELTIGLGPATLITSLTIRWPTGQNQVFTDLAVDRHYTLTEGTQTIETTPLGHATGIDKLNTTGRQ
ncbi:MAG: ASPIC/UnbV domain-containing protein, partial [Planctomycetaceae bacterium]